jgi:alpha-glucosidase (family GH31 glycosyl hydrolase)
MMRPLWYNFPKDRQTFNETETFMIGDSLMVVPKLKSASFDLYSTEYNEKHYNLSYHLPKEGTPWYEYTEKTIENGSHKMVRIKDILLFVRAGTIIPIKLHNKKLSLTRAQHMPIKLDVYLD